MAGNNIDRQGQAGYIWSMGMAQKWLCQI